MTPLPETGLNEPPRFVVQIILTSASRVFALISLQEIDGTIGGGRVNTAGRKGEVEVVAIGREMKGFDLGDAIFFGISILVFLVIFGVEEAILRVVVTVFLSIVEGELVARVTCIDFP